MQGEWGLEIWGMGGREREITKYNLERNIIFIREDIGKELKKGS